MTKKEIILIIVAVILIAAGFTGYYFWKKKISSQEQIIQLVGQSGEILGNSATQGVLPSINPQQANPVQNAPDINPINASNPFTNVKTNPF